MKLFKGWLGYDWGGKPHDPMLDRIDTLVDDEGLSLKKVARMSGVSYSTLLKWRKRKVKRPTFGCVMAVVRSTGHDLQIVKPSRKVAASTVVKFQRNVAAKADIHETSHAA